MTYAFKCHLCGKVKTTPESEWRALYLLAFHYDRRHKGWTHDPPVEDDATDHEKALYYAEFGILS